MYELNYKTDFAQGVQKTVIRRVLAKNDNLAHTIRVACIRNGVNEDLTGAKVTGYFIRADDATITLEGTVEGSMASLPLNAACYNVEGRCYIIIKLTRGDAITTIFWAEGAVSLSQTDVIVDTGETTLKLEDLFARLETAEADAAQAAESATASAEAAAAAQASAEASAELAEGAAEATASANAAADNANDAANRLKDLDVGMLTAEIDELRGAVTPKQLWSGTGWSSGSIDVDGISDWHVVQIVTSRGNALGFVAANVNAIGASMNTGQHSIIGVRFSVSGNTCTMVTAHVLKHNASSNHEALESINVTAIYGLLKKGAA